MCSYPNLDVYADPVNYDRESAAYDPEGTILLAVADEADGPVLELGCGTGRVTIPLAQQGIDMTGLDILPHLIEHAREKAGELDIRWIVDDVRDFQLDARYPLIFTTGLVFQHLLDRSDQEAMLARVREHLAEDGRFVIDVGFKHPRSMAGDSEEAFWYAYVNVQGREVRVSGVDSYDHLRQIWIQKMVHRWDGDDGELNERPVELALRYIMPQEMEALLYYNGFSVLARYGGWDGEPLTEEAHAHIYVCGMR